MLAETKELPLQNRIVETERPASMPIMYQRWEDLLFLHWDFDPEVIQQRLPKALTVDTFEGRAWVGVVPFSMRGVRPRFLPAVPGVSDFPELNLRTYVVDQAGRPGVWFFSLDTPKRLPNWIARTFFHLNYRLADIQIEKAAGKIVYDAQLRTGRGTSPLQRYVWTSEGAPTVAEPGTLEFFLCERYRLFAHNPKGDRLLTGRVHHAPYPLQRVHLEQWSTELFGTNSLMPPEGRPVSALCSAGVDVTIFPMDTGSSSSS